MKEQKTDTCAVLDADKKRLARGRFNLTDDGRETTFVPADIVTLEQMQAVAFLWPDGQDTVAVTGVRAGEASDLRFHFTLAQ